jgi:uncharacterized protein
MPPLVAWAQEKPNPSFPCDRAKTLDEKAICSDYRLAELDRLQASAYLKAKQKDASHAIKDARKRLKERALCGNDRICLLDNMSYAEGTETPAWVTTYRQQLIKDILKDDLRLKSYALVGKRSSFPTSAKEEQATLIQIYGVDTDHASATGRITSADFLEYCERDPGGLTIQYGGKLIVKQCVRQEQATVRQRTFVSRADCNAKQVILWDGAWQLLSYDGGITWKNPKGEIEEPWNGTAAAEGQFQLLCPNSFALVRADAEDKKSPSATQDVGAPTVGH